ncbi:glycosyltransferase [Crocosphaera sp. XPORK-15E]|uniref:glycosyltransferase n=1 Tax=Crocosphaera sp. XPORK-15E TaxID=3110247 RepID=UPI002B204F5C|nr:glycosyltransferase [Crocosphaera sp. XPORK-15E]MEA5533142.1 glycosyltransferase [Crocosphaera sp. XPORK-15E]
MSLVIPFSDDGDILETVIDEVATVLKENYKNYEIICVDDGSLDHTRSLFEGYRETVDCLRYFRLSRRFGLEVAISCGLEQAIGDVAVVLRPESDPPGLIPEFVEEARSCKGIVVGQRNLFKRRSLLYRLTYKAYYGLCQLLLERPPIYCSTHFMALTRTALNSLLRIKDTYRYLRVLSLYAGFSIKILKYQQLQRRKPERHRNFLFLLDDCVSMIISNSVRPLRLASAIALLSSFLNFSYLFYVIFLRAFFSWVQPGWAATSFQTATMFGLLFLVISVLCEYLTRLLQEVKVRPLYFIADEIHSNVMLIDSEIRNVVYQEKGENQLE